MVSVEIEFTRPTAMVFPARSRGLRIPDFGRATTAKSSGVHDPAGAITLMSSTPRAWASKKDT
jgi:hypothetical protein